jgi:3'-phosphoadenosine 5'-phosphosulfate (PAPS) 3'-phosphatase
MTDLVRTGWGALDPILESHEAAEQKNRKMQYRASHRTRARPQRPHPQKELVRSKYTSSAVNMGDAELECKLAEGIADLYPFRDQFLQKVAKI